jgi:phosphoglycerate dehydrogenase-like enzyme
VSVVTILDDYQNVALTMADWSPVRAVYEVDVIPDHIADHDELAARLARSQVVVAMRERTAFPAALFTRLPELQLLVTTGMRNASIDLDAAVRHGVTVCGTSGSQESVPELTLGMAIALMRNFVAEDASVRAGGWQHTMGTGLSGRTMGVIGLGRLGVPVARLAQAFGMDVVAWSPNLTDDRAAEHCVRRVEKLELFRTADVITVHMPLSERSRHLIGSTELAAMRPDAYLINTSRGPIVDEAALMDVLRERRIGGAALDVYDTEPLPAEHPIRTMPNTLLLPHIGYVTTQNYRQWFAQVVENISSWAQGSPVRVIASPTA